MASFVMPYDTIGSVGWVSAIGSDWVAPYTVPPDETKMIFLTAAAFARSRSRRLPI